MPIRFVLILLSLMLSNAVAAQGYFRYPALHDDILVFSAEGDLWKSRLDSSAAQRLTTHPAEETEAAISPDGLWIAFAANYEGAKEVYVIPIDGGIAKRVSFENGNVRVQGWTQSGDILYSRSTAMSTAGNWNLHQVNPSTLIAKPIPLADAVEGAIDSQGKNVYFTQFGLQVSGDNAIAYRGGAKGELWKYSLGSSKEASKLTAKHKGSARSPMLTDDRLYFISNQSGSDNIWSMSLNGKKTRQHTEYKDWTVRNANIFANKIVYQLGADIKIFDILSGKSTVQEIKLTSDFPQLRENWINKPLKYLTSAKQAGTTDKVVLTARGRVAIASTDGTRLVEIATDPTSRTRKALLSHDGKWVYALNDTSGEMEIWRYAADGSTGAKQLTTDGNIFRWDIYLSPDEKWIAHDDKNGDLWLLNINTGENTKILSDNVGVDPIASLTWSQDSQLIAITRLESAYERNQILLYDLSEKRHKLLTSDKYESFAPAFSPDGNWLYFLSNRHFSATPNAPWGDRNLGPTFDRRTQIFALALHEDAAFGFRAPTELTLADKSDKSDNDENEAKTEKQTEKKASKETVRKLDWQNLETRLWQVPVAPGNYRKLGVNENHLYVLDKITEPKSKTELKSIKIEARPKITTFVGAMKEYSLSNDGKKLFLLKDGANRQMYIVKAGDKFPAKAKNIKINTNDWTLAIDPSQEWQQIFHDAWLMHRDSLFDVNLRGLDWPAVQAKYQPLLSRITDRHELNDIFKQMMGELNTLHSQVRGGDTPRELDSPKASSLGAAFTETSDGVLIKHIYLHDTELVERASPLRTPGVNARDGDKIIALNGSPISTIAQLTQHLRNQQGKQVLLELERAGENIKTVVIPASLRDDYWLRYRDWVNQNQQKVLAVDSNFGYLHLHAMGGNDVASFAREFYAQYQKDGLIIDVRRNRGGSVDSWIIEKLMRRAWSFWQSTTGDQSTNMQQAYRGHLVVLADEFTYSDGETFAAGVKALGLADVIGKQTAGAGVWLSGRNRQSDNGIARVAEYPVFAMDGRWITEGHGITPDIEVDNLPYATFTGHDAQLTAAIKHLKKLLKKSPVKALKTRPYPSGIKPADDIDK
ncbi:MAG: tricorn protease [Paraglaciecola sp.]|jgi:tricorn protease